MKNIEIQVIKNGKHDSTIYPNDDGTFTIDDDANVVLKVVIV